MHQSGADQVGMGAIVVGVLEVIGQQGVFIG